MLAGYAPSSRVHKTLSLYTGTSRIPQCSKNVRVYCSGMRPIYSKNPPCFVTIRAEGAKILGILRVFSKKPPLFCYIFQQGGVLAINRSDDESFFMSIYATYQSSRCKSLDRHANSAMYPFVHRAHSPSSVRSVYDQTHLV